MKVIEKTRWEGGKTVVIEIVRENRVRVVIVEEREMRERTKVVQSIKNTRFK